ncbi:MAG: hypothetical protein AAGM16_16375, partial [Pseudomonadota bacterium]
SPSDPWMDSSVPDNTHRWCGQAGVKRVVPMNSTISLRDRRGAARLAMTGHFVPPPDCRGACGPSQ